MSPGASGSSTMRANSLVPPGPPDQEIGGETFSPSAVYLAGMAFPSSNAVLETRMLHSPPERCDAVASLESLLQPAAIRASTASAEQTRTGPTAQATTCFLPDMMPPDRVACF